MPRRCTSLPCFPRHRQHTDSGRLISGTWDLLKTGVGEEVFDKTLAIWNIVPFCAHHDADSDGKVLVEGIAEADLEYLAELQKHWLRVPAPRARDRDAPTVAFAWLLHESTLWRRVQSLQRDQDRIMVVASFGGAARGWLGERGFMKEFKIDRKDLESCHLSVFYRYVRFPGVRRRECAHGRVLRVQPEPAPDARALRRLLAARRRAR